MSTRSAFIFFFLFIFSVSFSQVDKIRIAKDTAFDIRDLVSFVAADTSSGFPLMRQKYFRPENVLRGAHRASCSDKEVNPSYTFVNPHFRIDFCVYAPGKVSGLELTVTDPGYVSLAMVSKQLKEAGFVEGLPRKENKLSVTTWRWLDRQHKLPGRQVILRLQKDKVVSVSFS